MLVVAAICLQVVVLLVGGFAAYRIVQRGFAERVEEIVIAQNADFADTLAKLFEEELDRLRDENMGRLDRVEFRSAEWDRLQSIIESEALAKLPVGAFACLIEEDNGQLLCHPEIRENPGLRSFSFENYQLRQAVNSEVAVDVLDAADGSDRSASGVTDFAAGDFHYLATKPIGDTGLRLLVHQPVDEVIDAGEASTHYIAGVASVMIITIAGVTAAGLFALLRRYDSVFERLNREMKANLETARRIQQGALPRTWPAVPGYAVAAWSDPAEETGGDAFDIVGMAGGASGAGRELVATGQVTELALMLADATGHGVGPAIAVTQLQSMTRVGWRTRGDLHAVASLVAERAAESLPDGRFITAWLARLDARTGELETLSAGQAPCIIVRAHGEAEDLPAHTYPLGIAPELGAAETHTIRLGPGDMFVVPSDGIIEAMDRSRQQFGTARFAALLVQHRDETPAEIAERVRAAVRAFAPGTPQDDQTLLIVKRDA
ncbi:MAG: PP2C family protein-serine/threonine phosphatase [Planctomycetota bacterium]